MTPEHFISVNCSINSEWAMCLLQNGAFLAHLSQSKVEAKQQMNSLIDAIYAKVILDLELWLKKHESKERNDSSVQQLGVNNDVNKNVNSPHSLPPPHLQYYSNHFTVKSELESDCEENVTEHNLPGESPDLQPTPPEPLKLTDLITPHSSSISIVKKEISSDDEEYNFDNGVEVNTRVIQNQQSFNDPAYLKVRNEFYQKTIPNMTYTEFPEFYGHEVSNRLLPNALTHKQREFNQDRVHFDGDLEIDQKTLNEVKREIEKEENMKQRDNELEGRDKKEDDEGEGRDMRVDDEGDRMESEEADDNQTTNVIGNDNVQHNSDGSIVIQQDERDTTSRIKETIPNESTTNSIQPNRHLSCPQCPQSFDRRSKLEEHLRMHTGERPFACDQCGKAFRQKGHLTRHQRFHQNIKTFHCDQCDKQFVLKIQLNSHLRTHSGERPFKCRFCEMSFTESSNRKSHEQAKHHHAKPYRCKICQLTSTKRSTTISHIRIVHFGLPKTVREQKQLNIIDDRNPKVFVEKV